MVSFISSINTGMHVQAKGFVGVLAALSTVEKVGLDIITSGEQRATCGVRSSILAIRAGDALRNSG